MPAKPTKGFWVFAENSGIYCRLFLLFFSSITLIRHLRTSATLPREMISSPLYLLDLNNRPVQILDEPHSLLRCHDVALIQAVLPVLVDQNHFHQNFVLAVLVVHLNIAVLQAIFTPIFFDDYPFTPPRVKPLAKYFWKNGKAIISGSTPIKAIATRTDSCGIVNCPSSAANSGLLAINSIC